MVMILLGVLCLGAGTATGADPARIPKAAPSVDIRYLQNSGWLLITAHYVLVFDFVELLGGVADLPPSMFPDFDAYPGRRVVVFVSHGHSDHYSSIVNSWLKKDPTIQILAGTSAEAAGGRVMRPHEDWESAGLKVSTTGSTDEGVGFLVSVDGITLFHAGDLAMWDTDAAAEFSEEIRWLGVHAPTVDIAFFPIATGAACDPLPMIWEGVVAAAQQIRPRVLFPMHVRCIDRISLYSHFCDEVEPKLKGVQVVAPTERGAWYRYSDGRVRPISTD